jgi:hypothetical protein
MTVALIVESLAELRKDGGVASGPPALVLALDTVVVQSSGLAPVRKRLEGRGRLESLISAS